MTSQHIFRNLLPIFFLMLPLAFPLQVMTLSPLPGGIPYIFLALHFAFFMTRNHRRVLSQIANEKINAIDIFILLLIASFSLHLVINTLEPEVPVDQIVKILLIYICSSWVYIYISRYAEESEIRHIFIVIILATLAIGLYWVYETYTKMILQHLNWYQLKMYDYFKFRNNAVNSEVNTSLLGTQYRAYGLLDKHTTTGAYVALGAFTGLALLWKKNLPIKSIVMFVYFAILSIGGATTAWLGFILLAPLALLLSEGKKYFTNMCRMSLYALLGILTIILAISLNDQSYKMYKQTVNLFHIQFTLATNIDGAKGHISFAKIYIGDFNAYVKYISDHPIVAVVGEGFVGHQDRLYPRGGDFAFLELIATIGIPLTVYFLILIGTLSVKTIGLIRNQGSRLPEMDNLIYGLVILLFLIFTLVHYNSILNNAIFAFVYLAFGLINRFKRQNASFAASPTYV